MGHSIPIRKLLQLTAATVLATACTSGINAGGPSSNISANYAPTTLFVSPQGANLGAYQTQQFTAQGGIPPYHFQITDGTGSIDYNTGLYQATAYSGSAAITVSDSTGLVAQATVSVTGNTPIPTPTPTTTSVQSNCSEIMSYPYWGLKDTSASGIGDVFADAIISTPSACASWCGAVDAGYCEWAPNGGNTICLAWQFGTPMTEYQSSDPVYSGACVQ